MYSIANNNIKVINPQGQVHLSTPFELRKLLPLIKAEWLEETQEFGKTNAGKLKEKVLEFIGLKAPDDSKRLITTKKFQKAVLDDKYFDKFFSSLEEGKEIVIKEWKFKTVDRIPQEIKKIKIYEGNTERFA